MKKRISIFLGLVLLLSLFAGCNKTPADSSAPSSSTASTPSSSQSGGSEEIKVITVAEALELCGEEGNETTERYYIRGIVETIENATYGQMVISDDTGSIPVYGTYSEDGSIPYGEMEEKFYKGDEVLLHCILQNFKGKKEVKNALLISFVHKNVDVDESKYSEMSILDARNAEKGTFVKVSGVVTQITYANGMKPAAIFLADDTNSILIHDQDLAQQVKIGNKITVLGTKTSWILDDEQSYADKFGYKGSCQLEDAVLLSNDGKEDNTYDRSWIQKTTIKDILDTPVSENITTTTYKVTALVKKVPGSGFVTYRFYDLDGITNSYAYTQCNGSDFAWLDEFDGKICTVYLSAINAKSTASACYFRLQPIEVIYENFQFDLKNTAQHIVKYFGLPQFQSTYSGDPVLELVTSVTDEDLGFRDAKLTYTSSNISILNFKEVDGKVYLRGIQPGTATVTITGSYDGITYSETLDITIGAAQTISHIGVSDAIAAAPGQEITVKGIVGPSLVNQSGFYLIDETGSIAISMDESQVKTLKIGHEVIIRGLRDVRLKDGKTMFGQSRIKDAEIVTNNYGSHEYSTASFVTDKTLADFYALDINQDYSTTVYVLKATVSMVESAYYTKMELTDGTNSVTLYCSSANQYSWLKEFAGQEVTLELAACNWNSKNYYAGCVLAVYTEDGKVINQLNFQ